MNPAVRAHMMAHGMGDVYADTRPRVVGTTTATGHSTRDAIFGAIGTGLQVLNNYIVSRPGANTFSLQPQQQYYQGGQYYAPGQAVGEGISTGFSNFAAQFGVSSTTLVLLGIAGVFLFTRK